jgi:outer membrane receptor protein involved in Fe transport
MRDTRALILAGVVLCAGPAYAQSRDAGDNEQIDIDEIVVTGSRIKRPDMESASPLIAIDAAEFQRGETNVVQVLNRFPAVTPDRSPGASQSAFPGSFINLRGLGQSRTLVLVNGRRYISTLILGGVDVASIPPELIKRVDVVTGGASATYGSDAIGGVVNFILDDQFRGLRLNAQTGVTDRGEGTGSRLSATAGTGFAGGKGSVYLHVSYDRTSRITARDRSFASPYVVNSGGSLVPLLAFPNIDDGSGTIGVSAAGDLARFGRDGELFDAGGAPNLIGASSYFDDSIFANVQQGARQINVSGGARYDVATDLSIYAEWQYINQRSRTDLAAEAIDLSGVPFSLENPFLRPRTAAVAATLADAQGQFSFDVFGRRFNEVGPSITAVDRTSWRGVLGFTTGLFADWTLDAYGEYQRSRFTTAFRNAISYDRLFDALDAVDVVGAARCRSGNVGCVPIDVFGPDRISSAAAAYIRDEGRLRGRNDEGIVSANATGTLFALPGGKAGGALGIEYRKITGGESPGQNLLDGATTVGAYARNGSGLRTLEGYAEINLPLLKNVPLAQLFSLEGGLRYTRQFDRGSSWTYKALAEWSPIIQVKFRGGFQRAIRQPNVAELSVGDVARGQFSGDPCFNGGPLTGTLRAGCLAQGFPAALADQDSSDPFYVLTYRSFGDPKLKSETARSFTIGAVFDALPIPNLTASVDFYAIKLRDSIDMFGISSLFNQCYASAVQSACGAVERDPASGFITLIKDDYRNTGTLLRRGIDLAVNYSTPVRGPFGRGPLSINSSATVLLTARTLPVPAQPSTGYDCVGHYGEGCLPAAPRWSSYTRVAWQTGPLGLELGWQWLGATTDRLTVSDPVAAQRLAVKRIPTVHYFDLSGKIDVTERMSINFSVYNMFDRSPPVVGQDRVAFANSIVGQYDRLGRRFQVGAEARF